MSEGKTELLALVEGMRDGTLETVTDIAERIGTVNEHDPLWKGAEMLLALLQAHRSGELDEVLQALTDSD